MNRNYKELIFTNHALQRLSERDVSQSEAWATWRRPKKKEYAATKGGWVFSQSWGKRQIEVVAKQNDRKEGVVLSVWSNQLRYAPQKPMWVRILKWMWKKMHKK